ncbi:MAG: Rrf2 family transcriptional regulator [Saprospiraceae bacterium]|nr:Rrf2 family transcriptional regulator [Saprospiraceae bacterium]
MLSKKAQYALKALEYLVERQGADPVLIRDISEQKRIPLKFLENILLELRNAAILTSKKGKGGGYCLKNPPEQTTLAHVIRVIDGPIAMLPCVSLYFYQPCDTCDENACRINKLFIEARDAVLGVLEHKTLRDLLPETSA